MPVNVVDLMGVSRGENGVEMELDLDRFDVILGWLDAGEGL